MSSGAPCKSVVHVFATFAVLPSSSFSLVKSESDCEIVGMRSRGKGAGRGRIGYPNTCFFLATAVLQSVVGYGAHFAGWWQVASGRAIGGNFLLLEGSVHYIPWVLHVTV